MLTPNLAFSVISALELHQVLLSPIVVSDNPIGLFMIARHESDAPFEDFELAIASSMAKSLATVFESYGHDEKHEGGSRKL